MWEGQHEGGREGGREGGSEEQTTTRGREGGAYLQEHGTGQVAELEQININVHVEGELTTAFLLLGLGVLVAVVEGAGDALGLRRGREGEREGGREGGGA